MRDVFEVVEDAVEGLAFDREFGKMNAVCGTSSDSVGGACRSTDDIADVEVVGGGNGGI
jgi:hypothetical protein